MSLYLTNAKFSDFGFYDSVAVTFAVKCVVRGATTLVFHNKNVHLKRNLILP
jgi:hypothetical protein